MTDDKPSGELRGAAADEHAAERGNPKLASFPDNPRKADALVEVSWEVCNKVGGIYTVVMSKANVARSVYGDNYYLIGPYFLSKAVAEFEETIPEPDLKNVFDSLRKEGLDFHVGTWLIEGQPKVILIDFENFRGRANDIKGQLWNDYKIDSLGSGYDFDEPVTFAWAAGMLIDTMARAMPQEHQVAQFHEWMTGVGLLYLKKVHSAVRTVFTTHATILGRSASAAYDLYANIDKIDPVPEAYKFGIAAKHLTEAACAQHADCFTTVSEITGLEAERFLGRKPDVLLPNGLDMQKFPTFEEISVQHKDFKFRIKEFILYHFFPYYHFNIGETYITFLFARYEFFNKGIDVFIEALSKLNERLKQEKSEKTIVAFLFVPGSAKSIKYELMENKRFYEDIKESIDNNLGSIRNRMVSGLLSDKPLTGENLFTPEFLNEVKGKMHRFKRKGKAFLCTHDLFDENNDAIINHCKRFNLGNSESDKVKVVFYPVYLTGADGLLDINYYETITGAHFGVFPSRYEPWGYTPLESAALGCPSLTTDMSGLGMFLRNSKLGHMISNEEACPTNQEKGMCVARAMHKDHDYLVDEITKALHFYTSMDAEQRAEMRMTARRIAMYFDWNKLFAQYILAHNFAIDHPQGG